MNRLITMVISILAIAPNTMTMDTTTANKKLMTAISRADLRAAQNAIKKGANVNYINPDGVTPLGLVLNRLAFPFQWLAVNVVHDEISQYISSDFKSLELLLRNNADPNLPSTFYIYNKDKTIQRSLMPLTPLFFLFEYPMKSVSEMSLDQLVIKNFKQPLPTSPDKLASLLRRTSLGTAQKLLPFLVLERLLAHGADPNLRSSFTDKTTPFERAIVRKDMWAIKLLLSKGAKIDDNVRLLSSNQVNEDPSLVSLNIYELIERQYPEQLAQEWNDAFMKTYMQVRGSSDISPAEARVIAEHVANAVVPQFSSEVAHKFGLKRGKPLEPVPQPTMEQPQSRLSRLVRRIGTRRKQPKPLTRRQEKEEAGESD